MFLSAVVASVLISASGAKPEEYTERSLCDLWAGAQCHATSCLEDGKQRCATVSRKCRDAGKSTVPKERADRTAACARALLAQACGAPTPEACKDQAL